MAAMSKRTSIWELPSFPNLDSIAEFRILTNNFDSEYGNYSGGQILVVTKSGTNRFHGGAFEYLRNTDLDARNFFSDSGRDSNRINSASRLAARPPKQDFLLRRLPRHSPWCKASIRDRSKSIGRRYRHLSDMSIRSRVPKRAAGRQQPTEARLYSRGEILPAGCPSTSQCVFPNAQHSTIRPGQRLQKISCSYIPTPNKGTNFFSTSGYNESLRDDKGALRLDADTRWGVFIVLLLRRRLLGR